MALTAILAFSTTASAQFGGLKGLANKAKKAVKEKVDDTASEAKSSVTSTTSEAVGGKTADNNESGAAAVSFDLSDSVSWAAERALAREDFLLFPR